MSDKLKKYRQPSRPTDEMNPLWPLYGVGLENLGQDGKPIDMPLPEVGPDELLVRHDACGLCFSDIKIINLGEEHPRIFRDIKKEPVVLGHEVAMTLVGVGKNLQDQYNVGDRFTIQADIFDDGVGYAYGYMIQGALSKYGVIDQRILNGDDGNYLVPVQPQTGYAESALTEPWACVTAAYQLQYRTRLKPDGTTWIIGTSSALGSDEDGSQDYTISVGFDAASAPARLLLTNVPTTFARWLEERAIELAIEIVIVEDIANPPTDKVDDIVVLGSDPDIVETVSPHLADFGVLAIIADKPISRPINVDVGRVHYNRWLHVGGTSPDVAAAYSQVPVRSTLKEGGRTWFVGAGGPMGRMHVQRAIQIANGPKVMVCTDVSDLRLTDLYDSYAGEASQKGIEFICLNPMDESTYQTGMSPFREQGFDDIIILAPIPAVIADAAQYLAPKGVMNIFAGVARGTTASLDLTDVYLKSVRFIGHSASTIADLELMLRQTESGELSPNRSVVAIGSLGAARDGIKAVMEQVFPGKIVIYPHIKEMPLTPLADLHQVLPTVYAKLKDGREWTVDAEDEFLRLMLED